MPFNTDLQKIKKDYKCNIYLETGLYKLSEKSSITKALDCKFDKVYSIELEKKWIDYATPQLSNYINDNKCILINDDSANLEKHIVNNKDFNEERAIFFLDAHVDNAEIKTPHRFKCPVIAELQAINKLKRNDHIICIDDIRIIKDSSPWGVWGETSYKNFYEEMIQQLKKINIDYKFDFLKGVVENDVLIAYI